MDYADDDAVRRYEMWEGAVVMLSKEFESDHEFSPLKKFFNELDRDTAFARMKREAFINAARIDGDEHLPRLAKAFPGADVPTLVQMLRVKVVELRLGGA